MFASSLLELPGPNRIRDKSNWVISIFALDEIVNSVPLILETEILVPPVIVISSLPEASDGSNLIAVVPVGTNKS